MAATTTTMTAAFHFVMATKDENQSRSSCSNDNLSHINTRLTLSNTYRATNPYHSHMTLNSNEISKENSFFVCQQTARATVNHYESFLSFSSFGAVNLDRDVHQASVYNMICNVYRMI